MAVWGSTYKSNPPNDNNPGYGAAAIRDLKSNLEGVIGNEHSFDFDETSAHGQHIAGSAICDYTNGLDDDDDYVTVDNGQVGRLTATMAETTVYDSDGDDTVVEKTTMKVMTDDGYIDILGYDQVSLSGVETIAGEKTFTTAPIIPVLSDADYEDGNYADGTIATVSFVATETTPINIDLSDDAMYMGGVNTTPLYSYWDSESTAPVYTIPLGTTSSELDTVLTAIQTELANLRAALTAVAAASPYNQDLQDSASPTFTGLTVDGTVSATIVTGVVWG